MRVARVARVRMVCRVRYESVLEGLLWASSGITVCDGMVHMGGVVNLDNSEVRFRVRGCSKHQDR